MKECEYCAYQGGNSLCEVCEAGSMMPDRQEEIHVLRSAEKKGAEQFLPKDV